MSKLNLNNQFFEQTKARNNYDEVNLQETTREENHRKLIDYYTDMLIDKPTLKVAIADGNYVRTFNMNGTLSLKDKGIVYSSISGRDASDGKNFGNFSTISGKDVLGQAGVLFYGADGITYFVFPVPTEITDTKIIGEFYEIELNSGWTLIKKDDGNMEIVQE
jgi:hypothetical protein